MDLGKAGIGKQRPLAMGRPNPAGIGFERVGREVVDVGVATARQQHRMGRMGFEGTGEQMAADDAPGNPLHRDQLEHVPPGEELHLACGHLAHQGLVGPIEQLLAGLTAGVKGAAHQGAAKVAVGQGAAVLPGEGHTLRHALVDDAATDFGEAVAAGLPGPKVAALERVGKEPLDAVAIVGVILRGVDAALGCHRMGPAGTVVEGDQLHPVALLRQGGRRRGPGQATAHHQHLELALPQRADQRQAIAGAAPGIGDRTRGNAGIGQASRRGSHPTPWLASTRGTRAKPPPTTTATARVALRIRTAFAGSNSPRLRWAASPPWNRCRPRANPAAP